MTAVVSVDTAGAQMGGVARYRDERLAISCARAMANRIAKVKPDLSSRVVVRPHPASVALIPCRPGIPIILCPLLLASYKQMRRRVTKLLAAVDDLEDPGRVQVTAHAAVVPRPSPTKPFAIDGAARNLRFASPPFAVGIRADGLAMGLISQQTSSGEKNA